MTTAPDTHAAAFGAYRRLHPHLCRPPAKLCSKKNARGLRCLARFIVHGAQAIEVAS
jgi:hypothetical protein